MRNEKKNNIIEELLCAVKRSAEKYAGAASTKGVFEPEAPKKFVEKTNRGVQDYERKEIELFKFFLMILAFGFVFWLETL